MTKAAIAGYETFNAVASPARWHATPGGRAPPPSGLPASGCPRLGPLSPTPRRPVLSISMTGIAPPLDTPEPPSFRRVLATVDVTPTEASRALAAIAVGYEVGVRISAARDLKNVPTTNTGLWGGQAATAAVGALRGLPPLQIAHAIAIAEPSNARPVGHRLHAFPRQRHQGRDSWAAANGLLAAGLAARRLHRTNRHPRMNTSSSTLPHCSTGWGRGGTSRTLTSSPAAVPLESTHRSTRCWP